MAELDSRQMAAALRRCGGSLSCDECPYEAYGTATCIQTMQTDAAALIEGMDVIVQKHERTIEALRGFVKGGLK